MKRFYLLWIPVVMACGSVLGAEVVESTPEAKENVLAALWAFLQTTPALVGIVTIWGYAIAALFTRKPKWQKYYDQYKGTIVEAVKMAEKAIPDDAENKSARRADEALKYVLKVIGKANEAELKQAINVVHAEVE